MQTKVFTTRLALASLLAVCLCGCEGYLQTWNTEHTPTPTPDSADEPDDPTQPIDDPVCTNISPGETPLPRLTEVEYNNTVRDLFPEIDIAYLEVSGDEKVGPFDANTVAPVGDVLARQYQQHAEQVSTAVAADLDQIVDCVEFSSAQIYQGEAEDIGSSTGQAQGDFWNLWSQGTIDAPVTVDRAGDFEIAVRAYADQAGGEPAKMALSVDGVRINVFDVTATRDQPEVYRASAHIDAGAHTVAVAFTNDFYNADTGADRNLLVDRIEVTRQRDIGADDACMRSFIEDFGRRAFRRPLSQGEQERLFAIYDDLRTDYGLVTGVRAVIEAVLQSPKFLYRFKFGAEEDGEVVELTDWEVASRLSYFLWDSMPDEALLEAAKSGDLSTADGIEVHARRMLDEGKARRAVNEAFMRWMGLDKLDSIEKSDPAYTREMRESMEATTLAFIDQVIWEGDGRLSTLLTAPFAYVDRHTAPLYGVEPPEDDSVVRVDLEGDKRMGLLTQPAVLARYAYGETPVHRGLFIREAFFCSRPPPPPDELEDPPETYEGQAARERAEDRLNHQQCGACHAALDPMGLAFDQFDELGRWEEVDEHGNELVSTGGIRGTDTTDTEVDGPIELARALAESDDVRQCVVHQWFRYAFARSAAYEDSCSLQTLQEALDDSDDNIRELLVAIATSDAFRYRLALDNQ